MQQFWVLLAGAAVISAWSAYNLLDDILLLRSTVRQFVAVILENPLLQQAQLRDGVRMAYNASNLLGALVVFAMVFIPLRYGYLMLRVHRGHPHTLRQVQTIAGFAAGMELSRNAALWYISMHNELIRFEFSGSMGLLIAVALLWYSRLRPVQEFFSAYKIRRVREVSPFEVPEDPVAA